MFSIVPAASRRNESSTASITSAGVSSRSTSASESWSARRRSLGRGLLWDDADLPVRLEHGPGDLVHAGDLLAARLDEDLRGRQPLAADVLLDHLTVLDDHDRLAVESRPQPREVVARERDHHLED